MQRLKEILLGHIELLLSIRSSNPNLNPQGPTTFLLLAYPWLVDYSMLTSDQTAILEQRKQSFGALGFNGEQVRAELEEILARDKHLSECCPTAIQLANYLDVALITPFAAARQSGVSQDGLDFAYQEFESTTYNQGRFKRILLTHLFNFDMEGDSATIGDVRIERLGPETIPRILGESGFQAFLHPQDIGNCFLCEEERPPPSTMRLGCLRNETKPSGSVSCCSTTRMAWFTLVIPQYTFPQNGSTRYASGDCFFSEAQGRSLTREVPSSTL